MKILHDQSLKKYNTFGIAVKAKHFCEINSISDLKTALSMDEHPEKFVLSGGSNMLLTSDLDSFVLHINLKGIEVVSEDDNEVIIKVMAGENWHQMVLWSLEQNYGGLENMSLIPGNTGTAPIQNIGAYGVQLEDVLDAGVTHISREADTETPDDVYAVRKTNDATKTFWASSVNKQVASALNIPIPLIKDNLDENVDVAVVGVEIGKSYAFAVTSGLPADVVLELNEEDMQLALKNAANIKNFVAQKTA